MCVFMHDGERLLIPPSLQGTVVQNTARSSLTVLNEVLRFKKRKIKTCILVSIIWRIAICIGRNLLTVWQSISALYFFIRERRDHASASSRCNLISHSKSAFEKRFWENYYYRIISKVMFSLKLFLRGFFT